MLEQLNELANFIGHTPMKRLGCSHADLYAKLEYNNYSGSSKDRAAYSIIRNAVENGRIDQQTTVIASSSGNLAIAVASICKIIGIRFIPVIDPNINKDYETLLRLISYEVIKVTKRDETGGFLLTRIDTVTEMCRRIANSFCADQYNDPNNYKGYYGLGEEIMKALIKPDYIFIAVSSSGAITGISQYVKARMPETRIIGVDVEGSVIFGQPPAKRYISGIGASQRSSIMKHAIIDDVVILPQADIVKGCLELLGEQVIFAGASSGAVYFAAKSYLKKHCATAKPVAALIFPDKGYSYLDTIYNKEWVSKMTERETIAALPGESR